MGEVGQILGEVGQGVGKLGPCLGDGGRSDTEGTKLLPGDAGRLLAVPLETSIKFLLHD